MAIKNPINKLEASFAVMGIIGLVLVSAISVSMLNPIVEQYGSNINSGGVAGISTEAHTALPLVVNDTFKQDPKFKISREENIDGQASFNLSASNLLKGTYSGSLFNIYNPNNTEIKTKASFNIPEALKGKIKVYLEDEKDSLIMYTREESFGPKTITLDKFSEREFDFKLEVLEHLSSVEMIFSLADGQ